MARRTGLTVMLPEYRGYAGLPGAPSYEGSDDYILFPAPIVQGRLTGEGVPVTVYDHG